MMNENNNGNGGCSKNPPKPRRIVISFFFVEKKWKQKHSFPAVPSFVRFSVFIFVLFGSREEGGLGVISTTYRSEQQKKHLWEINENNVRGCQP